MTVVIIHSSLGVAFARLAAAAAAASCCHAPRQSRLEFLLLGELMKPSQENAAVARPINKTVGAAYVAYAQQYRMLIAALMYAWQGSKRGGEGVRQEWASNKLMTLPRRTWKDSK